MPSMACYSTTPPHNVSQTPRRARLITYARIVRVDAAFVWSFAARIAPPTRDTMPSRSIIAQPNRTARNSHDINVKVSSDLARVACEMDVGPTSCRLHLIHVRMNARICGVLARIVHDERWTPLGCHNEPGATSPNDEVHVLSARTSPRAPRARVVARTTCAHCMFTMMMRVL